MLHYLVLAFAPGVFWMWIFWRKDKYEKEPASYLVKTFILGALMVIPAALIETVLATSIETVDMMTVGIIEEMVKFLAVYLYVYRKSEFNEVMDGIVYAAAASLGFASLENLFYMFSYGAGIIVVRAILSTLGHVLFASFWGYALGIKKMKDKNVVSIGLILGAGAHAAFNIILGSILSLMVIPLMVVLYALTSRRIRKSLDMSPFRGTVKGVPVTKCPDCGHRVATESRFCPNCGKRL